MDEQRRKHMFGGNEFAVTANCWRRGPDGSIAVYEIVQRSRWQRAYEHEGSETLTDQQAHNVAMSMVRQLLEALYPKLLYAIKSAQGIDPEWRSGSEQGNA